MVETVNGFETLRRLCAMALRGETASAASDAAFAANGLALAERHRVVPLFAAAVPSDACAALRRRMLALAQQTVRLEQELAAIAASLSAAGVEFLVLKGPAMARQAYPVPEWRAYDDLDLWVESRDFNAALHAMESAGYRRTPPLGVRAAACSRRAGIEAALTHPARGRLVELAHGWRALAPTRRSASEVREAAATMEIAGARIRTPAPGHALLLACAHGAHHRWDRLGWVADVAGLWQRLSPSEREGVCLVARRWRAETVLGLGLRLAAEHLDVALAGVAAALANAPRAEALFRRVRLEGIAHDSLRAPMIERLRFERDAQDSALRRLRTVAGWIFVPTLGDIEAMPLPAALYPLYAAIRPLRLLRHPWLRDRRKSAARG